MTVEQVLIHSKVDYATYISKTLYVHIYTCPVHIGTTPQSIDVMACHTPKPQRL